MDKISIRDIDIFPDSFRYKQRVFQFEDVAHLRVYRRVVSHHVAVPLEATKIGDEEHAGLMITMSNADELLMSEQPGWLKGVDKSNVEKILRLHDALARATFESRIKSYLAEYERYGFFYYGGYKFFPGEKCLRDDTRTYSTSNTSFLKGYGYLELSPKEQSLGYKIGAKLGATKNPVVDTLTDTDVIFVLLKNLFALQWKS